MTAKDSFMISLGNRIKQAREAAGITQEQLAERIGVSRTAVVRYELGEIEPKIKNLAAISIQLNVTTDYLLGLADQENAERVEITDAAALALKKFIKEIRKGK